MPAIARESAAGSRPDPATFRSVADLAAGIDRLRRIAAHGRGQARVSLADLATRTGIPRSTVHAYLTGKHSMPADALDAILYALGVSGPDLRTWADALYRLSTPAPATVRTSPAVPRQLPALARTFVGRTDELSRLDQSLVRADLEAPLVVTVCGPGGVGKSALAARWAHRHVEEFPDGQLWIDLHGWGNVAPLSPANALGRILRGLDPSLTKVPADLDLRAQQFRSLVADRRVLIVLDNARDSAQVRPLLPGAGGCAVLVTSRAELRALSADTGAVRLKVRRLDAGSAEAVLDHVNPAISTATVRRLVAHCEGLPLALRIVRELLHGCGPEEADRLVAELDDRQGRLDALQIGEQGGELSIRTILQSSFEVLDNSTQDLLARLPLVFSSGRPVTLSSACAISDRPAAEVRRALDEMVSANLMEPGPERHSYVVHDLVASFAEGHAATLEPDELQAADQGLARYLEHGYSVACDYLRPGFALLDRAFPAVEGPSLTRADALRWATRALDLAATVAQRFIANGQSERVWAMLQRAFWATLYRADVAVLAGPIAAVAADAQRLERYSVELVLRNQLGVAASMSGDQLGAIVAFERCVALARSIGIPANRTSGSANLAVALTGSGRPADAIAVIRATFGPNEDDDGDGPNTILTTLGTAYLQLGQLDRAETILHRCVEVCRANGRTRSQAVALITLSTVHWWQQDHHRAADEATRAIEIGRAELDQDVRLDGFAARLNALAGLGEWTRIDRELPVALEGLEDGLATSTSAAVALQLARARIVARQDPTAAVELATIALARAEAMGFGWQEACARLELTRMLALDGNHARAEVELQRTEQLITQRGFGLLADLLPDLRAQLTSVQQYASGA